MAGNQTGGFKAKARILARDPDFYKRIGRMGGHSHSGTGGFAKLAETDPERHRKISSEAARRRWQSTKAPKEVKQHG